MAKLDVLPVALRSCTLLSLVVLCLSLASWIWMANNGVVHHVEAKPWGGCERLAHTLRDTGLMTVRSAATHARMLR